MNSKSFLELFSKDEKNQKAFSMLIKIIIICVLLSILLGAIILYSSNLNKSENVDKDSKKTLKDDQIITTQVYDHEKLVNDYKNSLNKILENFNGNYELLKSNVVNLSVPQEYQKLQFDLVVALDTVIYESNKIFAKEILESILKENDWIKSGLEKVINSLQ